MEPENAFLRLPVIPESITVHLGAPDENAANVKVNFADYIKNVTSNEIYPTWPTEAILANILAQISYALNRVYTEYYPSRGYDFDITSDTRFDQSYRPSATIFENVSQLVDEVFTSYIRRQEKVEPLFAQYCDGIQTTCDGLSQWGSAGLAEDGLPFFDILQTYYGKDIEIVENVQVGNVEGSAPPQPLIFGSVGNDVRTLQVRLNRISANYPSIPKIARPDGIFDTGTLEAVEEFQRIFGLTVDGIVGNATWYKVASVFNAVKKLNELYSEGLSYEDVSLQFRPNLEPGYSGLEIYVVQYFLNFLAQYIEGLEEIAIDGVYGAATENALRFFQRFRGLPETGLLEEDTYNALYDEYRGIVSTLPPVQGEGNIAIYPGFPLREGFEDEYVRLLQSYLNTIGEVYTEIPVLEEDGVFGPSTDEAVRQFQRLFNLNVDGIVDAVTWLTVGDVYEGLVLGSKRQEGQFPGYTVGEEENP